MPRKKKNPGPSSIKKTIFHKELEGFDLKVNPFGEMESTFSVDKLNNFLDHQVDDKKIKSATSEEE